MLLLYLFQPSKLQKQFLSLTGFLICLSLNDVVRLFLAPIITAFNRTEHNNTNKIKQRCIFQFSK